MAVTPPPLLPLLLLTAVLITSSSLAAASTHNSWKKPNSTAVTSPPPTTSFFPPELNAASVIFPIKGNVYPNGLYYVSMNIGDPPKPYFLDVDTGGSDLTWIQCDVPCVSCFKCPHPLYKPKTESLVPCKDQLCIWLHESVGHNKHCDHESSQQCDYDIRYADGGSSLGVLLTDAVSLTLTNGTTVRPHLAIGCGYDQQGPGLDKPSQIDGVLGLGGGRASIVSQLRDQGLITRNVIGHCLGSRGIGYLFFGDGSVPPSGVTWAPMTRIPNKHYYSPGMASFVLGNKPLGVKEQLVVFDSGSSYTYFTTQPYETFLKALKNDLKNKPLKEESDPDLKICWKGAQPFKSVADVKKYFTSLVLNFGKGRRSVEMELGPENYLIVTKHGNACLGILDGTQMGMKDFNLIGDISLQDLLVIYDNEKQQIGWGKVKCAGLPTLEPHL